MQRYQIDLSDFFADQRQKVFVGKRDKWKSISCLVKHVSSVFDLNEIYLTNGDGVLFLEDDNLDVIRESDLLRAHTSTSLKATQEISAPKRVAAKDRSRASVVNQNGKRKREPSPNVKPMLRETSSSSGSESDDEDDDDTDVLPKIFVGLESMKKDETVEEIPKPKRKRIRKRKSKKVQEQVTPQKVVVKTYGKGKVPAIVKENGIASQHIRFSKDAASGDEDEIPTKNEPYRNLNKSTVARVVKAVIQPSEPMPLNDDCPPPIPDYLDDLNMDQTVVNSHTKQSKRKQKKSLAVKQELIEANTIRAPSPTWDSELDQAKENFLSNYTGEDFWNNLQEVLINFPAITIPSVNDIIAYRLTAEDRLSYLAFVERVDDGDSEHCPSMKLKLRRLNTPSSPGGALITTTYTLDQLMEIRLVATYQP